MKTFKLYLDDAVDDLFHELEGLTEGSNSHEVEIKAIDKLKAAETLSKKLIPFFMEQFEEQKWIVQKH